MPGGNGEEAGEQAGNKGPSAKNQLSPWHLFPWRKLWGPCAAHTSELPPIGKEAGLLCMNCTCHCQPEGTSPALPAASAVRAQQRHAETLGMRHPSQHRMTQAYLPHTEVLSSTHLRVREAVYRTASRADLPGSFLIDVDGTRGRRGQGWNQHLLQCTFWGRVTELSDQDK